MACQCGRVDEQGFLVRATHRALKSAIACWRTFNKSWAGKPLGEMLGGFQGVFCWPTMRKSVSTPYKVVQIFRKEMEFFVPS